MDLNCLDSYPGRNGELGKKEYVRAIMVLVVFRSKKVGYGNQKTGPGAPGGIFVDMKVGLRFMNLSEEDCWMIRSSGLTCI
jgi:hypothetical protein